MCLLVVSKNVIFLCWKTEVKFLFIYFWKNLFAVTLLTYDKIHCITKTQRFKLIYSALYSNQHASELEPYNLTWIKDTWHSRNSC